MPLTSEQRKSLLDAAAREGVDADELIAAAEEMSESRSKPGTPKEKGQQRPIAERLLVGFLPFIKVRELRSIWLGLQDRIPDDEMTCGQYQLKHGGGGAAPTGDE